MPQDHGKKKSKWGEPAEPTGLAEQRCEWGERTNEGHLSQRELEETATYLQG